MWKKGLVDNNLSALYAVILKIQKLLNSRIAPVFIRLYGLICLHRGFALT
ncbi:MAG: hypothetical protein ACI9P5_004796, partial [Saprospiraceae bacterium]